MSSAENGFFVVSSNHSEEPCLEFLAGNVDGRLDSIDEICHDPHQLGAVVADGSPNWGDCWIISGYDLNARLSPS